ncbi:MAG: hypothetical protein AAFR61_00770 [Bacteroidota bacterium]
MEPKNTSRTQIGNRLRQKTSLGIVGGIAALLALVFVLQPQEDLPERKMRGDLVQLIPDDASRLNQIHLLRSRLAKSQPRQAVEARHLLLQIELEDALSDIEARESARKALPGYTAAHWTQQKESFRARLDSLRKATQ